jgi:hypothetical protein
VKTAQPIVVVRPADDWPRRARDSLCTAVHAVHTGSASETQRQRQTLRKRERQIHIQTQRDRGTARVCAPLCEAMRRCGRTLRSGGANRIGARSGGRGGDERWRGQGAQQAAQKRVPRLAASGVHRWRCSALF